ncbi:MAG: SprT family zinc-dependent metalloprotease [Rhodoferax sp.]|nr:SprT family zinc-dependent metalloprotease [Rhodoferax sp.]
MHPLLRYTLDLFGAAPAPEPEPKLRERKPSPKKAKVPKRPESPASVPVSGPDVAQFAHPQASRHLQLEGVLVAYALARGQRRTIGMVVGPEGLSVRAPRWTPLHEIDAALQEKAAWIVRKLQETQVRRSQQIERQIVWEHGAVFPFLGQTLCVQLAGSAGAVRLGDMPLDAGPGAVRPLVLPLPATASATQIRAAVRAWLLQQAEHIFVQRLNHFAPRLQVRWKQLALSNAATRWGSARSDGSIRLNWRLVHFELPVLDYVVAHELSHLRVMNHSPRFWDTVRSVVPDYPALRARLKDDSVPRW